MRMPATICIYTLLTILPVYTTARCTGEGVREVRDLGKQFVFFPKTEPHPSIHKLTS